MHVTWMQCYCTWDNVAALCIIFKWRRMVILPGQIALYGMSSFFHPGEVHLFSCTRTKSKAGLLLLLCVLLLVPTWSFHFASATVQNTTSVSYLDCIGRRGLEMSSRDDFPVKEGCSCSPEGLFCEAWIVYVWLGGHGGSAGLCRCSCSSHSLEGCQECGNPKLLPLRVVE